MADASSQLHAIVGHAMNWYVRSVPKASPRLLFPVAKASDRTTPCICAAPLAILAYPAGRRNASKHLKANRSIAKYANCNTQLNFAMPVARRKTNKPLQIVFGDMPYMTIACGSAPLAKEEGTARRIQKHTLVRTGVR